MGDLPNGTGMRALLERAIAEAIRAASLDGGVLDVGAEAARLAGRFPDCGVDVGEILNRLVRAALSSGLAVEVGPG